MTINHKNKIRYDLHIHSALSPCAEDEMTPGNIVGMSFLIGLDVIAITDHQSCGNCAAAMKITEQMKGPLVIPGIEATSAEEIHLLCLFPTLAEAYQFEEIIKGSIMKQKNRPEIFGQQKYFNEKDQCIGYEEQLLLMPSSFSCDELAYFALNLGGVCIPAHVDREANSMISTLGSIPEDFPSSYLELSRYVQPASWLQDYPEYTDYMLIQNSDAHRLECVADPGALLELSNFTKDEAGCRLFLETLRKHY